MGTNGATSAAAAAALAVLLFSSVIGSSHEESSTVSVSSTSKVVIIYGTQRPNLDPTSYYTTPTTEATSYRKHPSIQTFTVGNDASATFETPPASSSSDGEEGHSDNDVRSDEGNFVTQTVTGFLDFTTTVGNTVMVFTPEGGVKPSPSDSPLIVTPATRLAANSPFDERPAFGLESLFENFERPKFKQSIDDGHSGQEDYKGIIKPSSVRPRPPPSDGVTHLGNGLVELDGAIDAAVYDRASREPSFEADEDSFRVVVDSIGGGDRRNNPTETHVASQTIFSNFINGNDRQVGIVTATGGTLIAHGVTTVHSTRVVGTYLDNGLYAQVVQNTAKVFSDSPDVKASPVQNFGSVQRVTERPSFGIAVSGSGQDESPKQELEALFDEDDEDVDNGQPRGTPSGSGSGVGSVEVLRPSSIINRRKSAGASTDFRERLKNRYRSYRKSIDDPQDPKPRPQTNVGRGTVTSFGRTSRRVGGGTTGSRQDRQRSLEESDVPQEEERSSSGRQIKFQSSVTGGRRTRYENRYRNRNSPSSRKQEQPQPEKSSATPDDLDVGESSLHEEYTDTRGRSSSRARINTSRFRSRTPSSTGSRRTTNRPTRLSISGSSNFKPSRSSTNFRTSNNRNSSPPKAETNDDITPRPKLAFKKFDRFKRPDLRSSLLEKILSRGKTTKNTLTLEEQEEAKLQEDLEREEEERLLELKDEEYELLDEDSLQNIEVTTEKDSNLMSTILVSTVYPEENRKSTFVEVATIRSPYSFTFEDGMSTRFITVTRSFTSSIKATRTVEPSKSTPLFQTETIPAPENILTSSLPPIFDSTEILSSIQTLPPVSLTESTPPLQTITETFSTKELILKTSVLPVVINGKTKHHTLTHSYYVTRLVEAVKVMPSTMKPYDFIPTSAFTDLGNVLDEAGSEKREEQLLPGELEFSDQEDFSAGPHEIRVRPPPGFADDLSLIGSKFDTVDAMEKKKQEEREKQQQQQQQQQHLNTAPNLQSSFSNPFANLNNNNNPFAFLQANQQGSTPALPNNQFGFNPQLQQQLALLQYLQSFGGLAGLPNLAGNTNPLAANALFGGNGGNGNGGVITTSKPVIKTSTLFTTNTIQLNFGNKKLYTTVTSAIGVTTVTEYEQETKTVSPAAAGFQPQLAAAAAFNLPKPPQYANQVVTTEAVVKDTVIPSTITKEIKIRFRNTPTITYLTSTTMVTTRVTEYVTKTLAPGSPGAAAASPAFNPLAALFG